MSHPKSHEHIIWLQKWESGKFAGWEKVGRSRVDLDEAGVVRVYSRQALIPIGGWNGVTCTLPAGEKPKDPESIPRRPSQRLTDEEPMA
jgi:hypothetical protein